MPPGPNERIERSPEAPNEALRAGGRPSWDKMLGWLRRQAQSADPVPFSKEVLAQHARFESVMAREEPDIVGNQLLWNEGERELSLWIEGAYHAFSRCSSAVLGRLLPLGEGAPEHALVSMAALSLAAGGSAIKWAEIAGAGRRAVSLADLHRVFAQSDERKLAECGTSLPFLDEAPSLTITAHYARVRILDALCHGTIGRQQAAIVDCWLREWVSDYPLAPGPVAKAHLVVDSPTGHGRRTGQRAARSGSERVLLIEPMAGQIEQAVRWFHEGRIYPGHGVATQLRVEEHVAVLDMLRSFLNTARRGLPERQRREESEAQVQVYVGLAEILAKSFAFAAGADAIPVRGPELAPLPDATRKPIDTQYEIANRTMRLLDQSEGGMGLEGAEGSLPLEAGTLIAIRRGPGELPVLCEVVRRIAVSGRLTRIGARVLSFDMKRITLAAEGAGAGVKALFVAGEDSSGRGDSIIVSASDFDLRAVHEVRFTDRIYRLRLNRIRYRGRGWVMAGMEVIDARDDDEAADFEFRD